MISDPSPIQVAERGQAPTLSNARAADLLSNWRLTPATMMAHLDPGWIPAAWLQFLSLKIATAVARGSCGILISAPPRHGKSLLSTIATPLWVLENFPGKNVIVATYGEELSTDFTRQVRDLIQQNSAELSVRLRQDARRVTNLLTPQGGGLKAVGLRGAITGRGADVLIIDDYIKEPKEALSPQYMEDLWTWWRTVARTRLEPGAVVIVLATRWVANDLHGRIMDLQKETGRTFFEYIELPAIARDDKEDPIGRAPGEVLFPERYNQESILDIKAELGSRWFNAMFQQDPEADGIKICDPDWFQPITTQEFDRRYQAMLDSTSKGKLKWMSGWDFASTAGAGDYTSRGLCLWNQDTDEFYIRNIARGQWSAATVEEKFVSLCEAEVNQFRSHAVEYRVAVEQEPGSSGVFTTKHFKELLRDNDISVKVIEQTSNTKKQLNAQPLLAAAENGKVFVVADYNEKGALTGWVPAFREELKTFPESANDDQVDCVGLAYRKLTGRTFAKPTFGRKGVVKRAAEAISVAARRPIRLTFGRKLAVAR